MTMNELLFLNYIKPFQKNIIKNPRNPSNIPRTLYPITGIMKNEKTFRDRGSEFIVEWECLCS